jgi:phenylalanyl-tRNA synthetase beta chain
VGDDPRWLASKRVRDVLVGAGMLEVRPMPFVSGGAGFVRVQNPLADNEAYLRRDVLDTLARRAEYNLARMEGNLRMFEIGSVFEPRAGGIPHEELHVGLLVMGRRQPTHFTDPKSKEFDEWAAYGEWDAKELGRSIASAIFPGVEISVAPSDLPDELWTVSVDGSRRGTIRKLNLDAPVWASAAFGVEISFGVIESADVAPRGESVYRKFDRGTPRAIRYRPLPSTPASEFDLALLVPEAIRAEQVESVIERVAGRLLERLQLFDLYLGHGVEPGHRSLAWRLTFRHAERTLREREIDARRSDILKALADELNVRTRTG